MARIHQAAPIMRRNVWLWTVVLLLTYAAGTFTQPALPSVPAPYRLLTFDTVLRHTKACVIGTVVYRRKMKDGDWHITLLDDKQRKLVTEIIPELPLIPPRKGMEILACGISRPDDRHDWNELHPVTHWEDMSLVRKGIRQERNK